MLAVSGLALLFTKFSFVLALPSFVFTGRLNISIWLLMPDPNVFSALNHINKKTKKKVSQATKTNRIQRLPCSYIIALATE